MKNLHLLLLVVLTSCNNNKDVAKTGLLEIIPTYCKYDNSSNALKPKLKLFKKGEKTEIELTEGIKVGDKKTFIVSDIEYGKYYIEYVTIYNQKNIVELEINQPKVKTIAICFDYLDYKANKNILLLDEQKIGETIIIDFFHQGCFSTFEKPLILKFTKTKDKTIAEYNGSKHTLTASQINLLREFEIELRSNHNGSSSSIDNYGIYNETTYETYSVKDESHQWQGFENLIQLLKF